MKDLLGSPRRSTWVSPASAIQISSSLSTGTTSRNSSTMAYTRSSRSRSKSYWREWTPPAFHCLLSSLNDAKNIVCAEKNYFFNVVGSSSVNSSTSLSSANYPAGQVLICMVFICGRGVPAHAPASVGNANTEAPPGIPSPQTLAATPAPVAPAGMSTPAPLQIENTPAPSRHERVIQGKAVRRGIRPNANRRPDRNADSQNDRRSWAYVTRPRSRSAKRSLVVLAK
jgi:hypothetical protein